MLQGDPFRYLVFVHFSHVVQQNFGVARELGTHLKVILKTMWLSQYLISMVGEWEEPCFNFALIWRSNLMETQGNQCLQKWLAFFSIIIAFALCQHERVFVLCLTCSSLHRKLKTFSSHKFTYGDCDLVLTFIKVFLFQFCDVVQLAIIPSRFSKIWLQTNCENIKNLLTILLLVEYVVVI